MELEKIRKIKSKPVKNFLLTAKKSGVAINEVSRNPFCYLLEKGGKVKYFYQEAGTTYFPLNTAGVNRMAENKSITNKLLTEHGLKVPKNAVINNFEGLKNLLEAGDFEYPIVIKPLFGTCGVGVSVNIENDAESKKAIDNIKNSNKFKIKEEPILLEEFFSANDYRLLVVKDHVVATLQRILPSITGDGQQTIEVLAKRELQNRYKEKKIEIDEEVKRAVSHSGYKISDILENDKKLILRYNANVATGARSRNVSELASSYFKDIACKAVRSLGLRYGGVDLMTEDISATDEDYRIIEVNPNAAHTVHIDPNEGESYNAAPDILAAIFK